MTHACQNLTPKNPIYDEKNPIYYEKNPISDEKNPIYYEKMPPFLFFFRQISPFGARQLAADVSLLAAFSAGKGCVFHRKTADFDGKTADFDRETADFDREMIDFDRE
jgi:hypothetical protein